MSIRSQINQKRAIVASDATTNFADEPDNVDSQRESSLTYQIIFV